VYKDGQERPNVLQYCQALLLPRLAELEPTFTRCTFPELETNPDVRYTSVYPENLPPGAKPRIPVTHDECSFNSQEGVYRGWVRNAHMPFYHKGRGTGMMVSEYVTPRGNLQLPPDYPEDHLPLEPEGDPYRGCTASLVFGDGFWWTGETVADQLRDVTIPLFEMAYPGCQAVFFFEKATNHAAFAKDALQVEKMNLSDGGAPTADMKDGWFYRDNHHHNQKLERRGEKVAKGMDKVLRERGLWHEGKQPSSNFCSVPELVVSRSRDFSLLRSAEETTADFFSPQDSGSSVTFQTPPPAESPTGLKTTCVLKAWRVAPVVQQLSSRRSLTLRVSAVGLRRLLRMRVT
jgi:hypothetical protein